MKKTTLLWTAVAAAAGVASVLLKRRNRSHSRTGEVNTEPSARGGSKHRTDVFSRAKSGGEGTNQPA